MPNRVRVVEVGDADREELQRRIRSKSSPARTVERARIVLLSAEGLTGREIAERVGCSSRRWWHGAPATPPRDWRA